MELLEGETLASRLDRQGPMEPREAVAIVAGLCLALSAVHAKGFLHRDIKPSNVFLARRPDGGADPKLIDFGIAKRLAVTPETRRRVTTARGLGTPAATALDLIIGTPRYLSPEQILGEPLDARTDLYALAVTLYEMLAGAPPFTALEFDALAEGIVLDPVPSLAVRAPERDVPASLDREVLRALAKQPNERPASAADFAAALWSALAEGRTTPSPLPAPPLALRSRRWLVAGAAALLALLTVVLLQLRTTPRPLAIPAPPVSVAASSPPAPPRSGPGGARPRLRRAPACGSSRAEGQDHAFSATGGGPPSCPRLRDARRDRRRRLPDRRSQGPLLTPRGTHAPCPVLDLARPVAPRSACRRAPTPTRSTQAKQRFAAGAQAYHEARYKDAIDLFLQANGLDPHPDLIYNVGQAYEKLGDVPAALRSYREYLRVKPGAGDRATVEASIKNLEARLRERGVQQVTIFTTPSGAELTLDQKPAGRTPWTGEIAPGRHMAILRASGYPDLAKEFVLVGDRAMDLEVALPLTASGAAVVLPSPQAPVAPPAAVAPPKPHVHPWTIAALGAGVVGLGAALGLELARQSAQSSAEGDPTQIGYHSAYSTMTSDQTNARVLAGVGAALVVTGGVLLVVDLRPASSAAPARAGLGCFLGACGAVASGRF